ncbi:hypothetical protein CEXT_435231 [Caerostris extrusa]|uniref:Uncharacterized protein n=1 Tax=Caerostris extrusa TaxID=172846 RepID=A0AAV4SM78_CAEEX|nr:hypothetical protein CEXT_435231 [Caerostris extrusa]
MFECSRNLIWGNTSDLVVADGKNLQSCQGVNFRIQRGYPVSFQKQLCQPVHFVELIRCEDLERKKGTLILSSQENYEH